MRRNERSRAWILAAMLGGLGSLRSAPTAAFEGSPPATEDHHAVPANRPPAPPAPTRDAARDCSGTQQVTIAAIGDVLLHHELQRQAYASSRGFGVLWSGVADLLARADVTYANLEGPTASGISRGQREVPDPGRTFDNRVYSGYPKFNYHPSVAGDLLAAGIDVVSTANNHALDRGPVGVDRTLHVLARAGVLSTGTRLQDGRGSWHAVTRVDDVRIAWLACTEHTNMGKDDHDQVLDCFDREDRVRRLVASLAADPDIDAVIVTPHWGRQYVPSAQARQVEYAQRWIDAGATAILGSHPHVLAPWEMRTSADGRDAFVIYSLGNFVSHQPELPRRSSIILYLGLSKGPTGTRIAGVGYVPVHVRSEGDADAFFVESIDRVGGPPDALALIERMYGAEPHLDPEAPLPFAAPCPP